MELIVISSNKLKIMLDEGDMRKYSIGNDTDCAEPSTRRAIRRLLDCAKEQIGFNTEGEEIFVQLYTSKHGGCELFVTKTKDSLDSDLEEKRRIAAQKLIDSISSSSKGLPSEKRSSSLVLRDKHQASSSQLSAQKRSVAYSFGSLRELCQACKALYRMNISIDSRVYSDSNKIYYLILSGTEVNPYSRLDKYSILSEFGNKESVDTLTTYIQEHGRTICEENAIQSLHDM